MGSVYDQDQTKIQQETLKEIKQNSLLTKWILSLTIIGVVVSIISIIISFIRRIQGV